MNRLDSKKMVVVDLESGDYSPYHEKLNLQQHANGNYYGYCPRKDGIDITKLGAKRKENSINNILVVYVKKNKKSNNREIIAFCEEATVFRKGQSGEELNRFIENNIYASYSVVSNNLTDLRNYISKFEIVMSDYNKGNIFRAQRFYGGTYPELDKKIIAYIESILETTEILDNDDTIEQEEIQKAKPASIEEIKNSSAKELNIVMGNKGEIILKNSRISKSALVDADFKCIIDPEHKTFTTKHKLTYMEGHHLIPCTVTNSKYFMNLMGKNIDCLENIVSICPNCHREVHYGEWESKSKKIKIMYKKQQKNLEKVGLKITEDELLNLYKI